MVDNPPLASIIPFQPIHSSSDRLMVLSSDLSVLMTLPSSAAVFFFALFVSFLTVVAISLSLVITRPDLTPKNAPPPIMTTIIIKIRTFAAFVNLNLFIKLSSLVTYCIFSLMIQDSHYSEAFSLQYQPYVIWLTIYYRAPLWSLLQLHQDLYSCPLPIPKVYQ